MRQPLSYRRAATFALSLALAVSLCSGSSLSAVPTTPAAPSDTAETAVVTVNQPALSVASDGTFDLQANVAVDRPTSYLEARLQVHRPSGRLLYQKTEVRSDLETGTIAIGYLRDLEDLDLEPGVYPIELRVRTQSDSVREWVVHDRLLVYAPNPAAVPLAVVAYICAAPATDPDGRFTVDPTSSVRARDDVVRLASWVLSDDDARATLALPGYIAEEWAQAADGYELATPEGVREIPADSPGAQAYARALSTIGRALETGRLELATVPYGSPDVGAAQAADRLSDLDDHLPRARSAYLSVFGTAPTDVLVPPDGLMPDPGLESILKHDISAIVATPSSIEASTGTMPSGAYADESDSGLTVLLTDETASTALASSEASGLVSSAFARAISDEASTPVVTLVRLGPGQSAASEDVVAILADLAEAPWLDLVTASTAASSVASETVALAATVDELPGAPTGYWHEVNDARAYAGAFLRAVGPNDPDAQHASDMSLVAQSGSWAGPDLNWGSAERGRSLAAAARRTAGSVLDAVTVGASEITLSGTGGQVPISIMNSSDKNLTLAIATQASGLMVDESVVTTVQVRPQENFVTVPVDLGQSLSGRLTVQLFADDLLLDEVTVAVRASFLDRLVLIVGVVVVLVGMLLFIRRRTRNADPAGTIE